MKVAQCVQVFVNPWTVAQQAPLSMNSPGQNTGVGSHSLLQGIFLTYELNLGLPHCGQILYCVSHWKANSISQAKKPYQLLLKKIIQGSLGGPWNSV